MSVFIRSLLNASQTIDSVALPAFALQERGNVTAAIQTALDQKKIQVWQGPNDIAENRSFYEYASLAADVVSLPNDAEEVSILPAGTIATLTINMPAAPRDGQRVNIFFDQIVTTLTQQVAAGSGHTLKGALAAATAKGFGTWRYRATGKVWYRVA